MFLRFVLAYYFFALQLGNLEKKLQHLEKNNFVMREYIASKEMEADFSFLASQVNSSLQEYNNMLRTSK
eukprot:m.120539 g.120539  ORF g.120539 m.120539 type:complete len:69 (+) comp19586_c0_seq2:75-281(+)